MISIGLSFDNKDESFDFQVCKWIIANKVIPMTSHDVTCTPDMSRLQGLSCIPPSAFYSSKHAHLAKDYIRVNFAKVSG